MMDEGPSGVGSPRTPSTPSFSPKAHQLNTPLADYGEIASRETSWWSSFKRVWNQNQKQSDEANEQQLRMRTKYNQLFAHETSRHHDLDLPQLDNETVDNTPLYRMQHRRRLQRPSEGNDDDDICIMEQTKPMTPVRSRFSKRSPMRLRSPPRNNKLQSPPRHNYHSPMAPLSPYRQVQSNGNAFWMASKRRISLWALLAILLVGPPAFLAGFFVRQKIDSFGNTVVIPPYDVANGTLTAVDSSVEVSRKLLSNGVFMIQDQILNQFKQLNTNNGISLVQDSNGNLILKKNNRMIWESGLREAVLNTRVYMTVLQADGNLITQSKTFNMQTFTWVDKVEWSSASRTPSIHHGKYDLMLTPNADGLMILREKDNAIVWSTQSVSQPQPPTPPPTRNAVPMPTRPPPPAPTISFPDKEHAPDLPLSYPFPTTVPQSQEYSIRSGPMVGHTTESSAKFWVYPGKDTPMELVYWPRSNSGATKSITLIPDTEANGAAIEAIQGLQSDTTYLYEIRIENEWLSRGHFKTAPQRNRGTSFKYVLASCMNVKSDIDGYRQQPVWTEIMSKDVDFAMLPGDTVYMNYLDWTRQGEILYGRVWFRYLEQRDERHFARMIKTLPTYGVWDNHDYGMDYSGRGQRGKYNSLRAWGHLWPNPYQGSAEVPGNFYSYSWGDVDFFVLDCRWYRSWSVKELFGPKQIEWLGEQLTQSSATFKIIVSASDVMEKYMTSDLVSLGAVIKGRGISGVLFNAGDIHRNEYKKQHVENWPYPVHQFSSSGVAVVWRRNFAIVNVNTNLDDPEIRVEFHAATSSNLNPDWINNRNVRCDQVQGNRNQEAHCTQTVRLSDLTP